jgi:hypothetical protein
MITNKALVRKERYRTGSAKAYRSSLVYQATMAICNRYEEVVDTATSFQMRQIAVSIQSSSTNKSNPHRQAVYCDTQREVDYEVYRHVDQESTKLTMSLRKPPIKTNYEAEQMVNEVDFERRVNAE